VTVYILAGTLPTEKIFSQEELVWRGPMLNSFTRK